MDKVFVFGSNEAGIHGAGAARVALTRFGAKFGQGFGFQGDSFAIPTKDSELGVLSIDVIKDYVDKFILLAEILPYVSFYVTKIGTGLAGYRDEEIAPLFTSAPKNCIFDLSWKPILGEQFDYFDKQL